MCDVGEERDEMRHGGIRLPREWQWRFGVVVVTLGASGLEGCIEWEGGRGEGYHIFYFYSSAESVCL